ncbi:MAG TPA: CDP-alcohol phosphatidyltransferase family protein, partial [Solirubrobacteraceae bacterium]|nr:CDP-alcohol phosphatidyltransferase family protein [Solirubrobacteraceae bacterium]
MPSIAELRAATQPASLFARNSGEHWAGRLYVRRLSPYVTRALLPTRVTPNAVTWAMIAVGVLAAAVLTLPGVAAAAAAALLIQGQILLDCTDGEIARWRKQFSPAGIYLDRFGHYLTETLLPIGLGIRADGGWDELGTYTMLGLVA